LTPFRWKKSPNGDTRKRKICCVAEVRLKRKVQHGERKRCGQGSGAHQKGGKIRESRGRKGGAKPKLRRTRTVPQRWVTELTRLGFG